MGLKKYLKKKYHINVVIILDYYSRLFQNSIIILDSVLYAYEKYHPQIFLECKYVKENMKTRNYIDTELKSESDGDSDSDSGTNNEE